ncbi:MAG: photosynthetic reaction center cytochrome c subunit, partial [Betaproteobacteria bacterium]|nr:photosynthetic reaction center cytochrome c subunit [Betaproteobacteria bacterium]
VYQNVQVLGDLSAAEFTRLMAAITQWVSPEQGCSYCHAGGNFAADDLYTKLVARRMLQMTMHINSSWKSHVAETGVTCYTCHRGQPVPQYLWYEQPAPKQGGAMGWRNAQNTPAAAVGLTSLPYDPFKTYFLDKEPIRVQSVKALPSGDDRALRPVESLQHTESNYALMMHFAGSLGVNCTYCHNSQNFSSWSGSRPQRVTAWHGIQMLRDLNLSYFDPLKPTYPAADLGPLGDAPKANCATCHQGLYKPLAGVSMLKAHPELAAAAAAK